MTTNKKLRDFNLELQEQLEKSRLTSDQATRQAWATNTIDEIFKLARPGLIKHMVKAAENNPNGGKFEYELTLGPKKIK